MVQVLHGCAKTTHAVRAELQRSKASAAALAERFGINLKTVLKWRKRESVLDCPMGPKEARSTVLTPLEEAAIVAFRKQTLLPLDDVLSLPPSCSLRSNSTLGLGRRAACPINARAASTSLRAASSSAL